MMKSEEAQDKVRRSSLIRPFYPAIDGLRAIAILLVFTWHYLRAVFESELWNWGWMGVNLFFVISGFLITGILVDSLHRNDFFRNFYIRRSLRIFPLYYAFWLLLLLATPFVHVQWNMHIASMAFYFGNLLKGDILSGHPDPGVVFYTLRGRGQLILIDHFWSLCVEEQFYLAWPLIIWLVRSNRRLLQICILLVLAAPAGRAIYQHTHLAARYQIALYYNTFARGDALLLGSALALWLRQCTWTSRSLRFGAIVVLFTSIALITILRLLEPAPRILSPFDPMILTIGGSLINIASAALLLLALETKSVLTRLLELRPLVVIGRISYGFYLFNELLFFPFLQWLPVFNHTWLQRCLFTAFAFLVIYVVATLSFRFIESPFLQLKSKLAPRRGAVEDPPPLPSAI